MYATRVTVVQNSDGATELNNGDSVYVHKVLVANSSASPVDQTFTESDDLGSTSTLVGQLTVPANDSEDWEPYAVFDTGFRVAGPASDVVVTVTWRPTG